MKLSPLGTSATIWPNVPALDDDDGECGAVGGIPPTVLFRPPQIQHDLNRPRTRSAAVGSRQLTA
jgi:hypothetical protein